MPSKLAPVLLIFALLVIAVVSWQWIDDREAQPEAKTNRIEMAETQSDYYLEDFEIINISNKTGASAVDNPAPDTTVEHNAGMPADRQLMIAGQSLSHHFIEGYSIIKNPIVKLRSIDDGQWHARASLGTVSANFDVLDLEGNVELTHNRKKDTAPVTVDTNSLTIDTGKRTISSEEPVHVEGESWQHDANNMNAEIDRGILTFTSGVEAQFEITDKR